MTTLRSTIESLASQFAVSVLAALKGASIDDIYSVAGTGGGVGAPRGRGRPRGAASASAVPGPRGRGGKRGRRSAGDIAKMVDSIVDLLQKTTKGLRAEQ